MRFPWVIVGNTGYDVEDIDNPRTHEMECPSCGKHVRFVEKELIKNLRVFGVALVGVEKGRRVFECPHCRVCVEPPESGTDAAESGRAEKKADPQIAVIEARIAKLDDEIWLWRQRAKSAAEKGVRDLEFEALEWQTKAEREAASLREKLATLKARPASEPPEPVATASKGPAIVARKGGEIVDRAGEDDFAALKAKLAKKQASGDEGARDASPPADAAAPSDAATKPPTTTEPARTIDATPSPSTESSAAADEADDAAFAALKSKLARKRETGDAAPVSDDADYQSLRQELSNEPKPVDPNAPIASDAKPAEPPGAAPPPPPPPSSGPSDDDDDPVAALKKKLRGK